MEGLPDSLLHPQWFFLLGVTALSYLVRGIAGFGSGLIAIPLMLLLNVPIALAVPLVVTLDFIASASQGIHNRQAIAWHTIWPLLPFSFIGVGLALYLFKTTDAALLMHALAVFILLYAAYSLLIKPPQGAHTRWWALPAGGCAGLIGTLFGTGGPFYIMYLQLMRLDKTPFRATFASVFLIDGTGRIAGYLISGFFSADFVWLLVVLLPMMFLSLYLGGRIHVRIGQETFKRAISALLMVSGIILLFK